MWEVDGLDEHDIIHNHLAMQLFCPFVCVETDINLEMCGKQQQPLPPNNVFALLLCVIGSIDMYMCDVEWIIHFRYIGEIRMWGNTIMHN